MMLRKRGMLGIACIPAVLGLAVGCGETRPADDGTAPAVSGSKADSAAIMATIANWERAWEIRDPVLAARDYAEDVDWTNAFGMRQIGRDSLQARLAEIFELPFVMAGHTEYEYHDLRFLGPGVALIRSRSIRSGQQLPGGRVQEPRRINHLRVFVKRDGRWVIVSHLIGDERTPGQPR